MESSIQKHDFNDQPQNAQGQQAPRPSLSACFLALALSWPRPKPLVGRVWLICVSEWGIHPKAQRLLRSKPNQQPPPANFRRFFPSSPSSHDYQTSTGSDTRRFCAPLSGGISSQCHEDENQMFKWNAFCFGRLRMSPPSCGLKLDAKYCQILHFGWHQWHHKKIQKVHTPLISLVDSCRFGVFTSGGSVEWMWYWQESNSRKRKGMCRVLESSSVSDVSVQMIQWSMIFVKFTSASTSANPMNQNPVPVTSAIRVHHLWQLEVQSLHVIK